jgi:predicted helicase
VRRGDNKEHRLHYHRLPENWRKEQKLDWLSRTGAIAKVDWVKPAPGKWLPIGAEEFETFPAIATKQGRAGELGPETIFKSYSLGVSTNRDEVVYGFSRGELADRVREFCENYNAEVDRYKRSGKRLQGQAFDRFLNYSKVKWSRDLKKDLQRGRYAEFIEAQIRTAVYRPFTKRHLYLADLLNDTPGLCRAFFPSDAAGIDNRMLVTSDLAYRSPCINVLAVNHPADLHLCASVDGHECFPFYVYESDGVTRHDNITDWALEHFRDHYNNRQIAKWDIFYYIYGILHDPEYRAKYAENLKRELPRIPLAEDFWGFSKAGKELAGLHIDYEKVEPWPLKYIETSSGVLGASGDHLQAERRSALQIPLSYRVEDKMRLAKDHRSLKVNDTLTLGGIPPETFEYRLGNRSALEWVIDQYQVTEDKHSGIRSDPNRPDDPEYIVRLVGQVIRVSLETVKLVKSLPAL